MPSVKELDVNLIGKRIRSDEHDVREKLSSLN